MEIAASADRDLGLDLPPPYQTLVERMSDLAASLWEQAGDAWYQRDRSAAGALARRDQELDRLRSTLSAELTSGEVPVPVAMELILLARCYERLGDHAVNVARRVVYLAGSSSA
jgi:phosphate transport system protein